LLRHDCLGLCFGMDWQHLASLSIVVLAAGCLLRSRLRRPRFSFLRDSHCGCAASSPIGPQTSIVYRARKGQRPEVQIKMR
jgi:hypothetical protein